MLRLVWYSVTGNDSAYICFLTGFVGAHILIIIIIIIIILFIIIIYLVELYILYCSKDGAAFVKDVLVTSMSKGSDPDPVGSMLFCQIRIGIFRHSFLGNLNLQNYIKV